MRAFTTMQPAADHANEAAEGRCDWCGQDIGRNVAVPCELRCQLDPPELQVTVICEDCAVKVQRVIDECRGFDALGAQPKRDEWICAGCGASNDATCWECGE